MIYENFQRGFRKLQKAFLALDILPDQVDCYWEMLKDVEDEIFERAVEVTIDAGFKRMPPPSTIRRVCKEVQKGYATTKIDWPEEIWEWRRQYIEAEIERISRRPQERMTEWHKSRLNTMRAILLRDYPARGF